MADDSQGTGPSTQSVLSIGRSPEARLVVFASRLLLVLNLILAAYFSLVVVPGIRPHMDVFKDLGSKLPPLTEALLNLPPAVLWAHAAGLALVLVALEFVVRNAKVYLICNAVGLVLFVTAILLVDLSLTLPHVRIVTYLQ